MKNKRIIDLLAQGYAFAKMITDKSDNGDAKYNKNTVEAYRKITKQIEFCTNQLDEESKFIIENEVIQGKKHNWYDGYLSTPTYYRHAKKAYAQFLNIINC